MDPDNVVTEIGQESLPPMEDRFAPMSIEELMQTLNLTIKRDEINKVVCFLAQLTIYTEDSQLNLSFNAPSSTGKSFIPMEIAKLFPSEDVMEVGYTSPTAFFHEAKPIESGENLFLMDLSRKIMIFLDQPHDLLLQHLRPVLSHDKKEIVVKITDKNQKYGLRTKNIIIRGFPVVIFCTAGLMLDEQESTRFLLLSPEINQEKVREAIHSKVKKESDLRHYENEMITDPKRSLLRQRIQAIKESGIRQVNIKNVDLIETMFFSRTGMLKPRHQRDIGKVINLIKALALLNLWFRNQEDGVLYADDEDIKQAFDIWESISESQDLGLPPYVYDLYKNVILAMFKERGNGLTKQEICQKHYDLTGRFLPD